MKRKFTFLMTAMALILAILGSGAEAWGQNDNLLCGGSFIGSFPNNESWIGSDEDYYSGNGYKFDTDETLQSPDLPSGVKKVTIKILVGHNGGATSTLVAGIYDDYDEQLAVSDNIVPTVAYTMQTDDAIQEFTLDGGTTDIKYVKLTFTKGKNYGMKKLEVYDATSTPTKTLISIAISGTPTKTTYETGESFDVTGLTVTGTYDDTSTDNLTADAEWTIEPATFTSTSQTSVSVTATVSEITSAAYQVDGLTVNQHVVTPGTYEIIPNNIFFGIEVQTTGFHDPVTGTQNDVTITHSGGSNFYCNASQVRTYKDNTLTFSVPTGYEITSIVLAVTDNASYSANVGTYTANTKTWTGSAQEIVLTSGQSSGNYQITKITVTFVAKKTLQSIAVKTPPTKTTYNAGETFDPAGLVITATYDEGDPEDIAYADNESDFSFSPTLETALTTANENVTITYGGKSVDQAITVTLNKLATPTNLQATYVTSTSATLTWGAVANASSYEVNVIDAGTYDEKFYPTTNSLLVEGLTASTEYLWSVKAIGDNVTYSDGDANEDGDFTTLAPPTVAYTVSFNGNEHGTPASESITEAEAGAGITLPNCTADEHFMFLGWTEDEMATEPSAGVAGDTYYPANNGVVLYAIYKFVITVTYVAVNGDAPQAAIVEPGSSITLGSVENVDCNTWQFAGWSESESSTVAPTLMAGAEYTPIDNVTLYAVYKKGTGSSDSFEYVFADQGFSNQQVVFNDEMDATSGIGWSATTGGSNTPKYYDLGTGLRVYNGGSFSVTTNGNTITNVTLTFSDDGYTFSSSTPNPTTWSGSQSTDISWSVSRTCRLQKVNVTYSNLSYTYSTDPDCSTPVATPTITPNGGEFIGSQEITLACTTEGATISYTTDDWETSNTYSAPFTITATTTLKVKATKEGMSESETVSATFTKIQVLETIQAIFDASATAGNYYVTFNNWVVSGVKGSNAYVTDGTKGFIVYKSGHGFEVGNILSGTAQLALTRYKGAAEFTNLTATTQGISVTEGGTVTPVEMNIADLGGVNTGAVITVNNVEYTGSDNVFSYGENNITAYNTFMALPSFTNGDSYNLTGVYIQFDETKEIAPRSAADIQLIVAAPTFTPEGGNYNAAQNVEIASATAGAAIYYTLDGSAPTVESTLYSAPIELTSNTTLKAIAAKAGSVSEIATAVYTITITTVATPTFEPEGGSYFNESLEVSLDCATDGATIVYTTDNWSTQTTYSDPFTITETTIVKAKATKAGMDDSEIAEATYTKRYKVNFVVNGDATAVAAVYVTPEDALGTLPTATAPNGYTLRGWNVDDVALTDVEPTYVTAEIVPTSDTTLYAVFAMAVGGGTTSVTKDIIAEAGITSTVTLNAGNNPYQMGELPITLTGIKGTTNFPALNYNATNGTDLRFYKGTTCGVTFATTNNSTITKIEFKKNAETASTLGEAFSANVGTLSANVWTGSAGSVTISYNNSTTFKEQMYIINVTYSETAPSTFYNFCTSVTALSGNLADATTVANTAYYISSEAANVPANTTATINGVLGNADASLLVIENGGQLICGNEVSATVRKSISGYTIATGEGVNGWYIIAAPITDAAASMAATGTYDLYTHDEAHYMWRNYQVTANQTTYDWFTSGYGYLYANAVNTTLQFAGTVAAEGQKEVNLTCAANDATHGWNLLGNHTTHNIFFTGNNIEDGYYVMNAAGNAYESRLTSVPVAPCEGFFVKATSNTTVTLNPQPVSKSEEETPAIIETRVTETANANYSDVAYIVKGHGNNLTKISFGETTPSLFFAENGKDYAITHISDETEVLPLYFKASANANYTLNFNIDGEEFDYVVLNDMKTGAQIDLLENSSYSFDATTEDGENRFNIVFVASATESISENMDQPFAYRSGNEFIISSNGTLQIIDALGRVISTQAVSGSARVNVGNLTQGTYIMRLIGDNTVRTQKIVVK